MYSRGIRDISTVVAIVVVRRIVSELLWSSTDFVISVLVQFCGLLFSARFLEVLSALCLLDHIISGRTNAAM